MDRSTWISRSLALVIMTFMVLSPAVTADERGDDERKGTGPIGRPVDATTEGYVLVPTHSSLRVFSAMSAAGTTHFFLDVQPGAAFTLATTDALRMNSCTLGLCSSSGDFDIVFFKSSANGGSSVLERFDEIGEESGTVPDDADYALVYLTTPGTSVHVRGFEFLYSETVK